MTRPSKPQPKPYAPAPAPFVMPPPVTDEPLFTDSIFSESIFSDSPFTDYSGGGGGDGKPPGLFSDSPFTPDEPGKGDSPFTERSIFTPHRPRREHHRLVVLPELGTPARNQRKTCYMLTYEEIEYVWELEPGSVTYEQGMGDDFTEYAVAGAENDGWSDCANLAEKGGCIVESTEEDGEETDSHLHPMWAVKMEPGEHPLNLVDLSQWDAQPEGPVWENLAEGIRAARSQLLADPMIAFADPMLRGTIGVRVLMNAGYDLPRGGYTGEELAGLVLDNLAKDNSIRASFLDLVTLEHSHQIDQLSEVANLIDKATEADLNFRHPDCLQFLCFDPAELPGRDYARPLLGIFDAVDVTYHSIFDPPFDKQGWSWCIGWREIQMKRRTHR